MKSTFDAPERHGDSIALIDRAGSVTYAELHSRVARVKAGLRERGVGPGAAVLVVTANERESAAAYRAVVELGGIAVLSHVGAGAKELTTACVATRPALAVVSPAAASDLEGLPRSIPTVAAVDLDGEPDASPLAVLDSEAPRLIVFTSGTTSNPKGVIHSARSLAASVACFQEMLELTADDRLFLVSPLGSITGVLQALELAPSVGGAAVLEQDFHDERSLDLLVDSGATAYGGPDVVLERMLAVARRRGTGVPLRIAALGGSMLRRELIDDAQTSFGIRVVRVYGSSEAPCSTGTRPGEPDDVRVVDEGTPGPGVELRLGADSELLVRGPHLFRGYVNEADNDGAMVDGWFLTGDEAQIVDGRLRITGRLKDVVSRNGKKISLAEVEQAFTTASGITECAAFGVPDPDTGERVAVAVHLADGVTIDVPSVLATMEASGLARWKLPESVVRTGPLPVTSTGKVRRQALTDVVDVVWRARRLATDSS